MTTYLFMNLIKPGNRTIIFICGFVLIVTSSCNLFSKNDVNDQDNIANIEDVYDGIYIQGFEDSWFEPCIAMDESWRPLFTDTTFAQLQEGLAGDLLSSKPFIRAKGVPSEKGEYQGWFALYDREFEIKEIVEVRQSESDDGCL